MIQHCLRATLSKSKMLMVQALQLVQGLQPSARVSGMLQQRSSRKKLEASFSYPSGSTADWIDRDASNLNVIVTNCMLHNQKSCFRHDQSGKTSRYQCFLFTKIYHRQIFVDAKRTRVILQDKAFARSMSSFCEVFGVGWVTETQDRLSHTESGLGWEIVCRRYHKGGNVFFNAGNFQPFKQQN